MSGTDDLLRIASTLRPEQLDLLLEMARALAVPIAQDINAGSDIAVEEFVDNLSNRLLMHHATHTEKLSKKSFEYAFRSASQSAGRDARVVSDPTNPGADVKVDGVAFSLKTEASRDIKEDKIHISKLMEARWIRDCKTRADFARETKARVGKHLESYERILILRALDVSDSAVKYELYEIPRDLLLRVRDLTQADFSQRTKNGSSRAEVRIGKNVAFVLRLDGSVEKVTISDLGVRHCRRHGSWTIQILALGAPEG